MNSDFSGRMLVTGTITGIREFRVRNGHLTAIAGRSEWVPGENLAECLVYPYPHEITTRWCSCGFYAYFDEESLSSSFTTLLTGLIEGYGNVTVGSRGFRAEKARIVCLIDKQHREAREAWPWFSGIGAFWLAAGLMGDTSVVSRVLTILGSALVFFSLYLLMTGHSPDRLTRKMAKQYGVPVYRSVKKATEVHPLCHPNLPPVND